LEEMGLLELHWWHIFAKRVSCLDGGEGDGKVAAPAQFSMQKAMKYLSKRGRITCRFSPRAL